MPLRGAENPRSATVFRMANDFLFIFLAELRPTTKVFCIYAKFQKTPLLKALVDLLESFGV
jgi:hypothetical protein